jgi:transposase-like protein
MGKRKKYTPEDKVKILRDVLEDGKQVSQVAEQYGLHPNNIFTWRKQNSKLPERRQLLPLQQICLAQSPLQPAS